MAALLALAAPLGCDDFAAQNESSAPLAERAAPLIIYTGVVGSTGWTLAGSVTAAGTAGCCGTYTDSSGGSYPIMFRMTPTASTPASATKTITGLTAKTAYTIAVKMKGNHWQTPPTLAITGGAQIVKAYSYMDPADDNQWREHSFVVYTGATSTSLTLQLSVYSNTIGATGYFAVPRVYASAAPAVPAPEVGQAAFVATPARIAAPTTGQNLIADSTWSLTTGSPWVLGGASFTGSGTSRIMTLTPTATDARAQQILSMWLPPSRTYTVSFKAGVGAGIATVYGYYLDTGANIIPTTPYVYNVANVVGASPTVASLATHSFTFTTPARYTQVKLYFEKYRGVGSGNAYFNAPTITANGSEWTDTPWVNPPATTAMFYDDFSTGLDPTKWLVPDKAWGGDNGGVYHTNVHRGTSGGIVLEGHGDTYSPDAAHAGDPRGGRRVGAAIVTRSYYASGLYEVRAKVPPELGACTAFWPFHYIGYSNGDAGYWAEPSPIRNTEIDWEMPTDYVTNTTTGQRSSISFNNQRENNWGGQWGGEGGESSLRNIRSTSIADGAFHTFGIRWKSGTNLASGLRTAGTVEWLLDGTVVRTFTGQTFGQDNVPFRGARFWIGIWFPAAGYHRLTAPGVYTDSVGWTGDPNFHTARLEIQWVRITPIYQNRDQWVTETAPSGYYAPPNLYP